MSAAQLPGNLLRSKNHVYERNFFFQTKFLSNFMKKSTTFINTKLLQFYTLPTLVCTLGEVIKDPLKKKTSDLQTKNWGWSLGPPESKSREFLYPGWKTKILAIFKNLTFSFNSDSLYQIQNSTFPLFISTFFTSR